MTTAGFDSDAFVTVYGDGNNEHSRFIRQSDGEIFYPDAVWGVRFEPSGILSEHPGEGVQDVADNYQRRSTPIGMVVGVSDTALDDFPDQTLNRTEAAIAFFQACEAEAMSIASPRFGVHDDLVLVAYTHDFNDDTDAIEFTLKFRKVQVATASSITGFKPPRRNKKTAPTMQPAVDDGVQPTEEADPNRRQSTLYKAIN